MNKQQASRLLTLAYFLKTRVDPAKFDMRSYCNPDDDLTSCGTTACAMGWATVVFPEQFELRGDDVVCHDGLRIGEIEFFGLARDESFSPGGDWDHLFGGRHARTPKQEAKVIEDFVAKKGWVYETA